MLHVQCFILFFLLLRISLTDTTILRVNCRVICSLKHSTELTYSYIKNTEFRILKSNIKTVVVVIKNWYTPVLRTDNIRRVHL